jgi:hypothetical protein
VRLVAGAGAVAVLAAAVAIALAIRAWQTAPAAVAPTPAQPVLTVVPQATPTAPPQASPSATAIPLALRQEIIDSYMRYWAVVADAAFRVDDSQLPEVAAGEELERQRRGIADLRNQGHAARIVVDHQFGIGDATQSTATVFDKYESRSYFIDPKTKEPLGQTPEKPETVRMSFVLQRIDGAWRVTDGQVYVGG